MADDPAINQNGARPVFIFDGGCGFCCKWALWLRGRGLDQVRFEPFDSLAVADRHGVTSRDMQSASYYVDESGGIHRGSDGFVEALIGASQPWRALAKIASIRMIRILLRGVYAMIAQRRHRLPAPKAAAADSALCNRIDVA